MGADLSRNTRLPHDIDSADHTGEWTPEHATSNPCNKHQARGLSTLSPDLMRRAGVFLSGAIHPTRGWYVLEIGAGNCVASCAMREELTVDVVQWVCTDVTLYNMPPLGPDMRFEQLHGVAAVAAHPQANMLLLVCPPPSSHGHGSYFDYYACRDWIEAGGPSRIIVFVGELGAADGSTGLYLWMMEHPRLSVVAHHMLSTSTTVMMGVPDVCTREMYVFEVL